MNQLFSAKDATSDIPHYYGNVVRRLFILNGVILLVAFTFFKGFLPVSPLFSTTAIVLLIIFAALTNPLLRWVNKTNVVISAFGFIIFENLAIVNQEFVAFEQSLVYHGLAGIFLFALYFAVKTFRAMAIGQITATTVEETSVDEEDEVHKSNTEILTELQQGTEGKD